MSRTLWRSATALTVVLVALAAWACGDGGNGDNGATSDATVTVIAEDTQFKPEEITVTSGQAVTLELENQDAFEHDLEVEGLRVEVIEGGSKRPEHGGEHGSEAGVLAVHTSGEESASITFVASDPGTYEFYCSIPGHRDAGMVGTLTVQ